MSKSIQPLGNNPPNVRWYRRNGWVTAMVAGVLLIGPFLAVPVLLILCTGPVYSGREHNPWDISTKALIMVFATIVTVIWVLRVAALIGGGN